jgi:hypothetical protein
MWISPIDWAWWYRESESGLYDTDCGNRLSNRSNHRSRIGTWYYTPNLVRDDGDWDAQRMLFDSDN